MEAAIEVRGLPETVAQPLSICQICAGTSPPRSREDDTWRCEPGAVILLVEIPLEVTLRDGCGCLHCGQSEVRVRVRVPLPCPKEQCWQNQWAVQAAVRMLGCAAQTCERGFCVRLEVNAEAYMVRSEPVCRRECKPQCPFPLPLFPPPSFSPPSFSSPRLAACCDG